MCCYSTVLNLKKKQNILNELQLKSYVIDILLTLAKLFLLWFWVTKFVLYLSSLSIHSSLSLLSVFHVIFLALLLHKGLIHIWDKSFQITEVERNALQKQLIFKPCFFLS